MYRVAQRTFIEQGWLAASVSLNILGLAGIAEDAMKWKTFLASLFYYYRHYVTDVIYEMFSVLWPDFFWPLPRVTTDIFVLMGGFFAAANFYTVQTDGASVFQRLRHSHCSRGSALRRGSCILFSTTLLYLFGPVIYIWTFLRGPMRVHRVLGLVFCPGQIIKYYVYLVFGTVCLLFVASQFGA